MAVDMPCRRRTIVASLLRFGGLLCWDLFMLFVVNQITGAFLYAATWLEQHVEVNQLLTHRGC